MPQVFVNGQSLDQVGIFAAQGVVDLTKSNSDADNVAPGRWLGVVCTNAGNVSVEMANGSTYVFPVVAGLTYLPLGVVRVNITGTTATATFANWL